MGNDIDPVAVYAAVVATVALGWEVWRWRSSRRGRLVIKVRPEWQEHNEALLQVTFINRNDYPVKMLVVLIGAGPRGSRRLRRKCRSFGSGRIPDLRWEVPPHDSVRAYWGRPVLGNLLGDMPFKPGCGVTVGAVTSLHQLCWGTALIPATDGHIPKLRSKHSADTI